MKTRILPVTAGIVLSICATHSIAEESVQGEKTKYTTFSVARTDFGKGMLGSGFNVRHGAKLTDNVGFVAGGSVVISNDNATFGDSNDHLSQEFKGVSLFVGPSYYVSKQFSLYASVGVMGYSNKNWSHSEHRGADLDWENEKTTTHKSITPAYGIGLSYALSDLVFTASYDMFKSKITILDREKTQDARTLSIGIGYNF